MDLATMTAAPTTVRVGERRYRIGPFRYYELGIVQRHLNGSCPRPPDAPPGWKPPQVGEGVAWVEALLGSHEGLALFLALLFGKHDELDDDGLAHLLRHVGPADIPALFAVAMDLDVPDGGPAATDPPKPGAAPSTS